MNEIVTRTSEGIFIVRWPNQPIENFMLLNFFKFKEKFNLESPFYLLHWQSKPFGTRRFGIYDGFGDAYYGVDWNHLTINVPPVPIQVDERVYNSLPSAVLLFPNSSMTVSNTVKHRKILINPIA